MKHFFLLFTCLVSTVILDAQKEDDIFVAESVMVQRCAMPGTSSRMIAVGYPGGFNYAFDAVRCAPVFAWYGGFLDFSGETNGRGGRGVKILGIQRPLGIDPIPFRVDHADKLPDSVEFLGYRRHANSGDPAFLYEVDGVAVEQRVIPIAAEAISIELVFPGSTPLKTFYILNPELHAQVQLDARLRWSKKGVIEIPANTQRAAIELTLNPTTDVFERKVPDLSGAQIYQNYCSACHSTDGTKLIGPTFNNLLGREEMVIRDGKTELMIVDEAYIRESILAPQAAVVVGYEQVPMADFSPVISREQMDRLVEYLLELD